MSFVNIWKVNQWEKDVIWKDPDVTYKIRLNDKSIIYTLMISFVNLTRNTRNFGGK